jgi:hypothetical protein
MKIQIAVSRELVAGLKPDATVEAEYGDFVVEGKQYTLAHHARHYRHMPSPCLIENQPSFSGDILISHIDLDTLGGCLALYGRKPECDEFWQGVAYIDTRGPHRIVELPLKTQEMMQAYWAYLSSQDRVEHDKLGDVTELVLRQGDIIRKIIAEDPELIDKGKAWAREIEARVEACLVMENDHLRAFKTGDVFCNSAYYSPKMKDFIPAIVSSNIRYGSILISFEDGGERFDASAVARKLWGDQAGGHAGIAGTPRGLKLSEDQGQVELNRAIAEVLALFG